MSQWWKTKTFLLRGGKAERWGTTEMGAEPLVPEVEVYPGKAAFKPTIQGQQGGTTAGRDNSVTKDRSIF